MALLFVVQEIPDYNMPEEIKMNKEDTGRKTIKETKKLLGVMQARKSFCTNPFEAYSSSVTG